VTCLQSTSTSRFSRTGLPAIVKNYNTIHGLKRHYFQGILKHLLLDMAVYLLRLDLIDAEVKFGNRSPIIPQWE